MATNISGPRAMLGRTYRLQRLEIIGGPQVGGAWPAWLRILRRGAGVHDFLWWHDKVSAGAAQRRVAATAAASAGQGRLAAGASPLQSQPRRCRRFLSKFTAGLAVGCGFLWGADPGPCPSGEAGDGAILLRWAPQPPCRRRRGRRAPHAS